MTDREKMPPEAVREAVINFIYTFGSDSDSRHSERVAQSYERLVRSMDQNCPEVEVAWSARDQQLALIRELRQRERTLIDLCHRVDAALQALPASPAVEAMLTDLEAVRLWWYPVDPHRCKPKP